MIVLANGMVNHLSKSQLRCSELAWDEYPEQDEKFIGKKVHLAYKDLGTGLMFGRLEISKKAHPEFSCSRDKIDTDGCWWRILRYDKRQSIEGDSPFQQAIDSFSRIVILIDKYCRVIVTRACYFDALCYPPITDWKISDDEVLLPFADNWEQFNKVYEKEPIFICNSKMINMVGKLVYTEYWKDLTRYTYDDPIRIISADPTKQFKPWEVIKDELLEGNPDLERMPECIMKSFPHYYPRHKHSMSDEPRRPINSGVILSYNDSGVGPYENHIVVVEYTDQGMRFVLDREAFIYYEEFSERSDIKELDLYNTFVGN